jgi:polyisoprenoid-binding protein YceI
MRHGTVESQRWIAIMVTALVVIAGAGYAAFSALAGGGPAAVSLSAGAEARCDSTNTVKVSNGTVASGDLDGTWKLTTGDSFVGYRVREQLSILPAPSDAVGRTTAVDGELDIAGLKITKVDVTADLTQLTSDRSQRDERIHTIGLETDSFPDATFTLTQPIAFEAQPKDGQTISAGAVGELTLHGVTNKACVPVQATLKGDTIQVLGSVDVVFSDYGMQAPNFGFVTTEDHGTIEFQLDFVRS